MGVLRVLLTLGRTEAVSRKLSGRRAFLVSWTSLANPALCSSAFSSTTLSPENTFLNPCQNEPARKAFRVNIHIFFIVSLPSKGDKTTKY